MLRAAGTARTAANTKARRSYALQRAPNPWVEIPVYTHLPLSGAEGKDPLSRNHINVLTADAVVVLHLLWIVFLILGALPGRRWAWVKWTHLASLAFSIALQAFGWISPLTYLEVWLRKLGGAQPYEGTFIRHYVEQVVYAEIPRNALFTGTLVVVVLSLWMYCNPKRKN